MEPGASPPKPETNADRQTAGPPLWHLVVLALLALWLLFYPLFVRVEEEVKIVGDSAKYFAWLQTVFEDGDLQFADDFEELNPAFSDFHLRELPTGYSPNYFPVGAPVLWTPFYLAGKAYVGIAGAVDREAEIATLVTFVRFGTRLYSALLLFLLFFTLRRFFDSHLALLGSVACFLGTAVYYYSVFNTVNSHAVSAFCAALLIFYALRSGPERTARQWAVVGLLGGLLILCRLQDAVVLLWFVVEQVPVVFSAFRGGPPLLRLLGRYGIAILVVAVVLAPQIIAWNVIFGPFQTPMDYNANEAYWTRPELLNILFSSRHGLFSWHPLTYLAVIGLFTLLKRHRAEAVAALTIFVALMYVNASMADWWGAQSFGMRRFVGITVIFALGTAAFASAASSLLRKRPQVFVAAFLLLVVWWNIDLAGLFKNNVVPRDNPPPMEEVTAVQLSSWFFGYPFAFPGNLLTSRLLGIDSYQEADWLATRYLFYRQGSLEGEVLAQHPSFREGFDSPVSRNDIYFRNLTGPSGVVLLNRRTLLEEEPVRTLAIDAVLRSDLADGEVPVLEVILNGKRLGIVTGTATRVYLWGPVYFRTQDWVVGINKLEFRLYVGQARMMAHYRESGFDPAADAGLRPNENDYQLRVFRLKFYDRKIAALQGHKPLDRSKGGDRTED
jgi:hypothetical protein